MINQKSVVTAQRLEATSFSRDLVTVDVRGEFAMLYPKVSCSNTMSRKVCLVVKFGKIQ